MYYSKETDLIYPKQIISSYKNAPSDLVEISTKEKHEHMGNITYEGKRRVPNTYPFKFEDFGPLTPEEIAQENSARAKVARDNSINDFTANFVGSVEFDGAVFQASERSYLDMSNAVRKAELNGYPDTDSRLWRLEDNSWRETTLAEIKQIMPMVRDVVDAANLQKWEDVWVAFNLWDAGDKQEPFEV